MKFFRTPKVGIADIVVLVFLGWAVWFVVPPVPGWVWDRARGWATGGEGVPSFQPWAHGFGNGATLPGAGTPGWVSLVVQDAEVVRVVDGDTLDVDPPDAGVQRVRLIGVDTPERGRCWADRATVALADLAPVGTRVTLAQDRSQAARDRYGRLLAYVYTAGVDGPDSVNRALLAGGHGRVLVVGRAPRFLREFRAAERGARAAGLGVWGAC